MAVRSRWRAPPAVRRWLLWLAPAALLALAALYAFANGLFAPVVPLSQGTGCDVRSALASPGAVQPATASSSTVVVRTAA